jgi:hypothetical protein
MGHMVIQTLVYRTGGGAWKRQARPGSRGLRTALSFAAALALGSAALGANPPASQTAPPPSAPILSNESPQFWFGVAVENIPAAIAKQLKLQPEQGVLVTAVFAGTPAAKAGIRPDDLLIELNGKPLTSQEDLARAANTVNPAQNGAFKTPPPLMQVSSLVYLREGNRVTTRLTPESRPADMLVSDANRQLLPPNNAVVQQTNQVRNMVLSNGNTVQYGPAYKFDSQSQGNLQILRQAVPNGQALILTQDTDAAGNVKNTINDGKNTYIVEPGNIGQLPVNYRPLAVQMLAPAPPSATVISNQMPAPERPRDGSASTDERLKRLEQQNEELKGQIEELKALLLKANPTPVNPATAVPASK